MSHDQDDNDSFASDQFGLNVDEFDPIKEENDEVTTTDKGSGQNIQRSYGSEVLTSHKSGESKLYDIDRMTKYEKLSFFRKQSHNLSNKNENNMAINESLKEDSKPRMDYLLNVISDENEQFDRTVSESKRILLCLEEAIFKDNNQLIKEEERRSRTSQKRLS